MQVIDSKAQAPVTHDTGQVLCDTPAAQPKKLQQLVADAIAVRHYSRLSDERKPAEAGSQWELGDPKPIHPAITPDGWSTLSRSRLLMAATYPQPCAFALDHQG